MEDPIDPIDTLAKALARDNGLKLWSVLVTILGDMSQDGGDAVAGTVLAPLLGRVGLQAQAMRVALHRLKRDGWVESRRTSRVGYYQLSASGLAQTRAVRDRVYGRQTPPIGALQMAVLPASRRDHVEALLIDVPALVLSRDVVVFPEGMPDIPEDWLTADIALGARPAWVEDVIATAACDAEYAAFAQLLHSLPKPDPEMLWSQDVLALRILVLHGWRRLVLRANPVAEAILGPKAAAVQARAATLDLLDRYPRPDPADMADWTRAPAS